MGKVTISTHNGSAVHQGHNVRSEKVVSREEHIDPNGIHETWVHEPVRQAYHRLFDEAVLRYNETQPREERKITNYYNKMRDSETQNPAYEMIIGIYGRDEKSVQQCSDEVGKQIMKKFVDTWHERNPNLELIGAYYHADEQGEPHVHIDYIPVAHGYTRGMDTQAGLVKAFREMGFEKQGRATAQIQWGQRENRTLEEICNEYGLEVAHPKQEGREHLDTETYKATKTLESTLDHTKGLLDAHDEIRAKTAKLEATRNKAEKQAEKAIERKAKAYSKSWRKDKNGGWNFDKGLEEELRTLVKERAEDVKAISHTDLDVKMEYDIATQKRIEAQEEAENIKKLAKQELAKAQEYKDKQKDYILGTAKKEAETMFDEFIQKEFGAVTSGRAERLEKYCKEIKFKDSSSVFDKFEEAEKELKKGLERVWVDER